MLSLNELKKFVLSNKSNLVYSMLILINSFAYGINANILGATMDDLSYIYDATLDTMSYVPLATGIGYLLGALVGWLYKWLNRQLMLTLTITMLAVSIAFIPYYGNIYIALFFVGLNGIGDGAWDASADYWIVEMWPKGNAAMLQLMQFMYGAGAVVAPLLAAPYVYGEEIVTDEGRNITVTDRIHSLTLPFAVTGINQAIVPVILLVLFFTNRYKPEQTSSAKGEIKNQIDFLAEKDQQEPKIPHRMLKLLICGMCFSVYASAEMSWFNFSSTMFQNLEGSEFHADDTAYVLALLFVTYAAGRLVTTFITMKLSPGVIISYHFVIIYVAFVAQYFVRTNLTLVTIANAVLGYGFSAMIPGILAFTEHHLRLSNRICSMYSFGLGVCSLIIPLIMGQTFDEQPVLLFFLVGAFISLSLMTFVGVWCWIAMDKRQEKRVEASLPW